MLSTDSMAPKMSAEPLLRHQIETVWLVALLYRGGDYSLPFSRAAREVASKSDKETQSSSDFCIVIGAVVRFCIFLTQAYTEIVLHSIAFIA